MESFSSLYHAFCEFAYSLSKTSHTFAQEEKRRLGLLLKEELSGQKDVVDFVLKQDCMDLRISYLWVKRELQLNATKLTSLKKEEFKSVVERVGKSFPDLSPDAWGVASNFIDELGLS